MAICLVTEFSNAQQDSQGRNIPVAKSELTTQTITYDAPAQSAAFSEGCKFVRIIADADVYVKFGTDPTAANPGIRLPADTVEYFGAEQGMKISCYDGTT